MEKVMAWVLLLCACGVPGLTHDDVFGLAPSQQSCNPVTAQCATLTGSVTSACDGRALDARVAVGGKATCSSAQGGKAYFELRDLPPGGQQTLAAGKTGYQAFSATVTLEAGFNAAPMMELTPIGGCGASVNDVPCTCTEANCE